MPAEADARAEFDGLWWTRGSEAAVMTGACTPRDSWRVVLVGPVLPGDAQNGVPGLWGIGVSTRRASGSGRAMRCVVIGRGRAGPE